MVILGRIDRSMVRAMCGVQLKVRMIYTFDVYAWFEWQCSLLWSCVEERGWPSLEKGIRF